MKEQLKPAPESIRCIERVVKAVLFMDTVLPLDVCVSVCVPCFGHRWYLVSVIHGRV